MPRKKTKEEFIAKARAVHGDKYDYSKVEYVNAKTKVCIICPQHGEFWQSPKDHLLGKECLECSKEKRIRKQTYSSKEFIEKAKLVHGEKYDYSKVEYVGSKTKVILICPKHGEFLVRPNDHLMGVGCPKCAVELRTKAKTRTQSEFIRLAKNKFPQYDYSLVKYKNSFTKIKVICPIHGIFEIKPYHLLNGHGCFKCGQNATHEKQRKGVTKFIEQSNKIHLNKYIYSKVEYKNCETKVIITCPIHGDFEQTPHIHLRGVGCPKCSESHLERDVRKTLEEDNISYIFQKRFEWLGSQSLDFYLPKYNVAIECQGIQHFEAIDFFGGEEGFNYRQERDERKEKLCQEHNVRLIYYSNIEHEGVETNLEVLKQKILNE